jgi:hypothetical protein
MMTAETFLARVMIVTVILATDPSRSDGTWRPTQRRDTLSDFTDTDEIVE